MYQFSSYGDYQIYFPSVLVLVVAYLLCFRKWLSPPRCSAPGPPSLPIIGNLHLLGTLPHRSLYNLSQSYGPIMCLHLGSVPLLVVSSSSMAREILKIHDAVFASRPGTAASENMAFGRADIAFASYGASWRSARQLCNSSIFSNQWQNSFTSTRAEEVASLVRAIHEDSITGKETHVMSKLMNTANNVISRQTFGRPYTELRTCRQNPSHNIISVFDELLELYGVYNVGDYIPYVQWMDLQGYVKRTKAVGKELRSVFQEIIDERRERRKQESSLPQDLLDVLLSASQETQRNVPIKEDHVIAILLHMLVGGTETSSVTVEWALAELLNNPSIMKKLQAELDTVLGSERFLKESDIEQLPYLQAVVKETMRLHPPGPLLLPRESMKPCQVAGYDVPAKTQVYVNVWAISRDENDWERPLEFWPERFMESYVDVRGRHLQLIPFGAGRRACPGLLIGLQNVQMMLGSLVQGFEWHLPSSKDESVDMTERYMVSMKMANPIVAQATPRLPSHLYSPAIQQTMKGMTTSGSLSAIQQDSSPP